MHSYHSNLASLYLVKHFKIDCFRHEQLSDAMPNRLLLFNTSIHHLPVLLLNSPQTSAQSHQVVQSSAFMGLSIKWLLISKSECRQAPQVSFTRLWDSKCALFSQVKEMLPKELCSLISVKAPGDFFLYFFQLLIITMELRGTDVFGKKLYIFRLWSVCILYQLSFDWRFWIVLICYIKIPKVCLCVADTSQVCDVK